MDILFQIHYEWNKELFCLYYQTKIESTEGYYYSFVEQ